MERKGKSPYSDVIMYNTEQQWLEINGHSLQQSETIAIAIIGYWISGSVQRDNGGWYLLTDDEVGIRLRPGLRARRPGPLFSPSPAEKRFPGAF